MLHLVDLILVKVKGSSPWIFLATMPLTSAFSLILFINHFFFCMKVRFGPKSNHATHAFSAFQVKCRDVWRTPKHFSLNCLEFKTLRCKEGSLFFTFARWQDRKSDRRKSDSQPPFSHTGQRCDFSVAHQLGGGEWNSSRSTRPLEQTSLTLFPLPSLPWPL